MATEEKALFIEVTDFTGDPKLTSSRVGVHSVQEGFRLPRTEEGQSFRFITEAEASVHPARGGLFGETPEELAEWAAAFDSKVKGK